jgi:hypothetical protein
LTTDDPTPDALTVLAKDIILFQNTLAEAMKDGALLFALCHTKSNVGVNGRIGEKITT